MAAATPGCVLLERVIPAPFEVVWAVAADLEDELPRYQPVVRRFRVAPGDGDRLPAMAYGWLPIRERFDAVLRPGWCWMQSRSVTFGLAAVPVSGGTLLARAGSTRRPGLKRVLMPILRSALEKELDRFEARVDRRRPRGPAC
ncbi:hypothetical protein [Nonomuraea sp. NPDC003754]